MSHAVISLLWSTFLFFLNKLSYALFNLLIAKMNSTPILAALASTEYQCIEPLLCQIDQTLTLRTFIAGSYTLNPLDEQIWTILQSNRVALGLIRRNALPNLTRWFTYIEADQPRLRDSAIAAKATNPDTNRYNVKLQHIEKGVVTRFPPEPSYDHLEPLFTSS